MSEEDNSELEKFKEFSLFPSGVRGISKEEYARAVLAVCSNKHSVIPELALVLPHKELMKFLHVFAGQNLAVPSRKDLEKSFSHVLIFFQLKQSPNTATIDRLAEEHDLSQVQIRRIAEKIAEVLDCPNPLKA